MSYFSAQTKTVEIEPGHTVTVRRLTYGEQSRVTGMAMRVAVSKDGGEEASVNAALLQMETAKLSIVAWAGPNFDNLPATPANVEKLPPWVIAKITPAINAVNEALSEDEKKASDEPTNAP